MTRKARLFPLLASLLLAALLLPAAGVSEIEAGYFQPGEIVQADFTVISNPGKAVAATLRLVYDHNVFELIPSNVATSDTVVLMDMSGLREGMVFPVSFRIHPSAANGVYRIRMDLQQAGDINEKPVVDLMIDTVCVRIGSAPTPTPSPTPTRKPATPTPTPTPTKKPATPSPKPTATPVPRDYALSSKVTVKNGKTTVTWTDSENLGPYQLAYECVNGSAKQSSYWAGANEKEYTVSAKKFTFNQLVPGYKYIIKLYDSKLNYTSTVITVPYGGTYKSNGITSNSVKVTITPKYRNEKGTMFSAKELDADNMVSYLEKGTRFYGVRYEFTIPKLTSTLNCFVQIVISGPNGFTELEMFSQETFDTRSDSRKYWLTLAGDRYFQNMYEKNGSIASGTYTIEMYWDGLLVNSSTFNVK